MEGFQLAAGQGQSYERWTATFMRPLAAALVTELDGVDGIDVVDLACGTGLVARCAAAAGARVTAVDVNPAMLAVARSLAPDGVRVLRGSASALPLADASADAVLCQQGLQFVGDPVRALAECARVLRPGGVVLATVWSAGGATPYVEAQLAELRELDAGAAAAAQLATPADPAGLLRGAARAAGLTAVEVTPRTVDVDIPSLATFLREQTLSTPWGRAFAALAEAERARLVGRILDRLDGHRAGSVHRIPFGVTLLRATRD